MHAVGFPDGRARRGRDEHVPRCIADVERFVAATLKTILVASTDGRTRGDCYGIVCGGPHNEAVDILTLVGPLGTGVLLGVLGDRLALRRENGRDRLARARDAAQALLPPLRRLRDLARDSQHETHHPRVWSEAIAAFARCCDDVGHRLPDNWRHLRQSVRAAVGEFVGGVAMADLDKRMVDYPLAAPDPEWLMHAVDYLEYVVRLVQQWQDEPSHRRVLLGFDAWLAPRRA